MALGSFMASAQETLVKLIITPDHDDYHYKAGEKATFEVQAFRCNVPIKGAEMTFEVSEDMMEPRKSWSETLKSGKTTINAGTMDKPGFLRVKAKLKFEGKNYEAYSTVGYNPDELRPVTEQPEDFDEFWKETIERTRKLPLNAKMTLMPEKCTDKVDVYHISYTNNSTDARFYGMLAMPKAPGKYPAIIKVPGAGIRPYNGDVDHAAQGVIVLELGVHGIPVDHDNEIYHRLRQGMLKDYPAINMDSRDRYYYKHVFTGCVKGADFIETLPQYNGKMASWGGSQGGMLSIMLAALEPRICALVSMYPAMSDMAGYAHGRAGGWPHALRDKTLQTKGNLHTLAYYDTANLARRVKQPGFYIFGYNDMVCPPTTTMSVYNVIDAPKQLWVAETTGHYSVSEYSAKAWNWILDYLKNRGNEGK
ncbi:MAG: acetylxylan esterase [Clostridium sp.]|nr:acetylxylan esterase [Clostridium sp.]